MPVYEYVCDKCSAKFEALRPVARMDDPALCPSGHANAKRVLSVFAAVHSGGDGSDLSEASGGGCGGECSGCSCSA